MLVLPRSLLEWSREYPPKRVPRVATWLVSCWAKLNIGRDKRAENKIARKRMDGFSFLRWVRYQYKPEQKKLLRWRK
jgi:hypothetical protein